MYREKAAKLLDRLRSFNVYRETNYYIDYESQKIIESFVNECKATAVLQQIDPLIVRRYESSFTLDSKKQ